VGFAVYYADHPADPRSGEWHQIGIDEDTGDGVTQEWDSRSVPGQSRRRPASVTVLVVPCLGLGTPFDKFAQRTYVVSNRGGPPPPTLHPPGDLTAAELIACTNVQR
jgi:hypothetical protein